MHLRILIILLVISGSVSAGQPSPDQIISRFYALLFQEQTPTTEDEKRFFGDGGTLLTSLPATLKENGDPAPIWTFLREHRHWFITEGHDHADEIRIMLTPIPPATHLKPKGSREFQPIPSASQPRVMVTFPGKRSGRTSGYQGIRTIIFQLGDQAYLDPSGILFLDSSQQQLMERVFELYPAETRQK